MNIPVKKVGISIVTVCGCTLTFKWLNNRTPGLWTTAKCRSIQEGNRMIGAQIFFRHGARTTLSHASGIEHAVFDKDIWLKRHGKTDISYTVETYGGGPRPESAIEARYKKVINFPGGMGAGVLTNLGRDQAFALGERLRDRYILEHRLVGDWYEQKSLVTRSTNVNRCVESLQSVVAGMYGPFRFKEKLKINMMPTEKETLFPNPKICPTLREIEKMFKPYVQSTEGYQFLSRYIKYFTGDKSERYVDLMSYRDQYVARKSHGLYIPPWLEAINEEVQKEAARVVRFYSTGTKDDHYVAMQLAVGSMFYMVIQNFEKLVAKDEGTPSLHLYSAHDTTLVPLLVGLGIYDDTWPPYSADLAFELFRDPEGNFLVQIRYMSEPMILPGFDEPLMPLEAFKKHMAPFTTSPAQFHERCHNMDLARENAEFWEAMKASKDVEAEEYPPNM